MGLSHHLVEVFTLWILALKEDKEDQFPSRHWATHHSNSVNQVYDIDGL